MCTKEAFEFSGTHDYTDDYTAVTGDFWKEKHRTCNAKPAHVGVVGG